MLDHNESHRLYRSRSGPRRGPRGAARLRRASLAGHRCDPALDRGDCGGDHEAVVRRRMASTPERLILASASAARAAMLRAAGVDSPLSRRRSTKRGIKREARQGGHAAIGLRDGARRRQRRASSRAATRWPSLSAPTRSLPPGRNGSTNPPICSQAACSAAGVARPRARARDRGLCRAGQRDPVERDERTGNA